MIIRRKPIGHEGIRRPHTLGLSLLREAVTRVQALAVQRRSATHEPIDWGEGVPDDIYADYDAPKQVDAGEVEGTYDNYAAFDDASQQAEQPIPNPASQLSRTVRRRDQRQVEPPPQVITPPPPPDFPVQRQPMSAGTKIPSDFQALLDLHKRLDREKPHVGRRPDGSPIPRTRAQIVEMRSKKTEEPETPRSASPIGEPIQREVDTSTAAPDEAQTAPAQIDYSEPAQLSAGPEALPAFDNEATLTDFRVDSLAEVRRSPVQPMPRTPGAPPVNTGQSSIPPGAAREFAPPPQFDGGDPDAYDEESETGAQATIQGIPNDTVPALRRTANEAVGRRPAHLTAPDATDIPAFEPPADGEQDLPNPVSSPAQPPPRQAAIQRTPVPNRSETSQSPNSSAKAGNWRASTHVTPRHG